MSNAGERAFARLLIGGALAAAMTIGTLAAPAQAGSAGYESILGGHIKSRAAADKIAKQARATNQFKGQVFVQKISSTNYEVEIFNGGSKSAALAACAKAKKTGLPHCSVEQEFHGNGWSGGKS